MLPDLSSPVSKVRAGQAYLDDSFGSNGLKYEQYGSREQLKLWKMFKVLKT